ncbi:MAG: transporter [bacterium]
MKYILFSILTAVSLSPVVSVAQESLVTDRPDFVESSSVVTPGVLQVEGSFARDRTRLENGNIENWSTPFLFRLGIFSNVEARLESDWYTRTNDGLQDRSASRGGISDMSIGIKWAFSEGDEDVGRPAMAALLHTDLPTGSQEFKGTGVRPSLRVSAEWSVRMPWEDPNTGDGMGDWGVGIMPGVMIDRNEMDESYYSGIFGFVISKGIFIPELRAFTEIAFEQIQSVQNGGSLGFIQAGGTYLLNPSWQLDAAFAVGITENASDLGFTIGLSGFIAGR